MTLAVEEFLRPFLFHLLPPSFVRMRSFGFLANPNRAMLLPLCMQLLGGSEQRSASATSPSTEKLTHSGTARPAAEQPRLALYRLLDGREHRRPHTRGRSEYRKGDKQKIVITGHGVVGGKAD
jgi:hypothetical protein